jgi:hypothetical protein
MDFAGGGTSQTLHSAKSVGLGRRAQFGLVTWEVSLAMEGATSASKP